jgi:hypothetical protein
LTPDVDVVSTIGVTVSPNVVRAPTVVADQVNVDAVELATVRVAAVVALKAMWLAVAPVRPLTPFVLAPNVYVDAVAPGVRRLPAVVLDSV